MGLKQYKHTDEARAKMRGRTPWNKGKKATDEMRKTNSIVHQGIRHTDEARKKMSKSKIGNTNCLGYKASEETKRKMSVARQGAKHPNWKGGITPLQYLIRDNARYLKWRQDCFLRDDFTCQKCGDNKGGNLNVHHKKPFLKLLAEAIKCMPLFLPYEAAMIYTPLWNLSNGVTLCEKCHKKIRQKKKKRGS